MVYRESGVERVDVELVPEQGEEAGGIAAQVDTGWPAVAELLSQPPMVGQHELPVLRR